jgi:2'-5' RNA ligase
VVRLPAPVAEALAPALDRLRALGPGHHWYPPETMHVTVQNLGRLAAGRRPRRPRVGRGLGHANLARFSGPVITGRPG